jgi:cytochrome bd ubiquinol oxidase subunit II
VIAATAVGAILLASVTLYAVLGGADFGGGLWDLLAGGGERGAPARRLIDESITPVWEANHVWLVFDLVIFWTAFPHAFAAVMITLALPLWLAAGGIVLRGAGFAFRKEVRSLGQQRALGAIFALSSLFTPFFMGTVIGAIAAGQVPAVATHASLAAWTGPLPVLTGFLFTGACGYLAAVYLISEAGRRHDRAMAAYFVRRAQVSGIVTGALSIGALLELHSSNPWLFSRLTGRALPLVIAAGLCGLAVLGLVTARRVRWIRVIAALGVAAVIWGWGIARYPVLLPGTGVTLTNAGAPHSTLVAIVVLFVALVLLIGPSFGLLFFLHSRQVLGADHSQVAPAGPASDDGPAQEFPPPLPRSPGAPGATARAAALGLAATIAVFRFLRTRVRGARARGR